MNLKTWSYFLAASFFVVCSILSCNKNNSDVVDAPPKAAQVAFYNVVPNGLPINMYVNGTRQNNNKIDYEYSSGYMSIRSGQQLISFKTDSLRQDLFTPGVALNIPLDSTTIVVAGKSASDLIYTRDTAKADAVNTKPKFRFVNASSNSPAYDVIINQVSIANRAYKSVSAFSRVDAGKVSLKINLAGTSTSLLNTTVTLQASGVYTLFIYGLYQKTGAGGLTYTIRNN